MADIISSAARAAAPSALRDDSAHLHSAGAKDDTQLLPLVEMLFFAYRDFTGEADAALLSYGLGRAHHRVLHFVNRHPGIRVADLLELLKITKQSLGRVLRKLVADGWIEQAPGPDDRRERLLSLTPEGSALAAELVALQVCRIGAALREVEGSDDAAAYKHVRDFLFAMISQGERATVRALVAGPVEPDANRKRSK
jgi:DNA-binding MarR family transcriptional regulator